MATLDEYRSPAFVKFCETVLENFMSDTNGVKKVVLATIDGFQVASCGAVDDRNDQDSDMADKLAAVGSTLYSLGSSVSKELALGETRSISIDSNSGRVSIFSIGSDNSKNSLILLVETSQQAMLAHILHGARKLAEQVGKRMSLLG